MRIIVSKFGGSSTAGANQFRRVWEIVRAKPARRCVVLSAPGAGEPGEEKVTAMLEACWQARDDHVALLRAVSRVVRRFSRIANGLGLADDPERTAREIVRAVRVSKDQTLSRGESLCAALFSRFSGIPAVDAAELVAFDAQGRLDESDTLRRFRELSSRYERVVVPGFYGAMPDGAIRLFPRNGSDISGALAAAGMGAGLYENWSDVPGLMTADPAIVPRAKLIRQVGYSQMRALARAGARVLHPACLDPVAMAGIPTRLRCTWTPESFGTLVDDACDKVVPCLAGKRMSDKRPGMSEITVFGVPFGRIERAFDGEIVRAKDTTARLYAPAEEYEETVRHLHQTLIEG